MVKRYRYPRVHKETDKRAGFNRSRTIPIKKIKPQMDSQLKPIFEGIGVPEKSKFQPDAFQLEALKVIKQTDCLVTAPTGAGKTWIAEEAIAHTFKKEGRAWYASPLKALSNSKVLEFSAIFGEENVGILTGDRKENADASIIVGTTEILRNQLYDAMHMGKDLDADLVVLDEAHFLGDAERGVVWEEIMIYLPQRIPLLLLSATIGNAHQVARWLTIIRNRKCVVVEETNRPVPLFPLFFHPSGMLQPLLAKSSKGKQRLYKKVNAFLGNKNAQMLAPPSRLPPMGEILKVLKKYNLLPAIFFMKSRADCDGALELCRDNLDDNPEKMEKRSQRMTALIGDNPHITKHRQRWHLQNLAVGSHHSGQLPVWKLILESLMTDGLLDAVFATSTVAAGVNFPARSVVFFNSDRFNGQDFMPLGSTEFHQMTGRAGRRGMDKIGFALAIPGKYNDIRHVGRLFNAPSSNVLSQIRINFSMVLNLLLSHTPSEVEALLRNSFANYLLGRKKRNRKIVAEDYRIWEDFINHITFLKESGFVDEHNRLTFDGLWASQLRVDQPLLVAESLRLSLLPEDDPALLAAVFAAFVNEKETDGQISKYEVTKTLINTVLKVKKGLRPLSKHLMYRGFETRSLYLKPALNVYLWAKGEKWEDITKKCNISDGDLSMLIMRTADNLRHIRFLKKPFPTISKTADEAIELMLKPPVVAEMMI